MRVEIDRRTLSVAQTFLSRLSPLECELRAVSEAVDRVVVASAAEEMGASVDEIARQVRKSTELSVSAVAEAVSSSSAL